MRWVVLAALLLAALAGCTGKAPAPRTDLAPQPGLPGTDAPSSTGPDSASAFQAAPAPVAQPTTSDSTTSAPPRSQQTSNRAPANGTDGGDDSEPHGPPPNHAPAIDLFVVMRSNGTAPFVAEVTLRASDQDGDALTYVLAWGDGQSDDVGPVPPTESPRHTYYLPGNYTLLLTVNDPSESTQRTLRVHVEESEGQGTPSRSEGSGMKLVAAPCPLCYLDTLPMGASGWQACAGFLAGINGLDCLFYELLPSQAGRTYTAAATAGVTGTNLDIGVWFLSECSPEASTVLHVDGSALGFPPAPPNPANPFPAFLTAARVEYGRVPSGAGCVLVYSGFAPVQTLCFGMETACAG